VFRKKSLPIVCIQHINEAEKLIPGQTGFDLPDTLTIESTDTFIHKSYSNGFTKTNLEKSLKEMEIDTIIISGFCAEYCVLSTYRGAQDKDLTPVILRSSLASGIPENIKFVENISDIISLQALDKVLS
jgi:nicotinamidase-related amidase